MKECVTVVISTLIYIYIYIHTHAHTHESPLVTRGLNSHLKRVTIPDAVLIQLSS